MTLNAEQNLVADTIGDLPQPNKCCGACEALGGTCYLINMSNQTQFQRDELLNPETTVWSDRCTVPGMFELIDKINALGE